MFFTTLLLATASVSLNTPLPTPSVIVQSFEEPKAELNSTSTIKSYIEEEAIKKDVDPKLATSISHCESGFIPRQSDIIHKGIRENSWGVWQINLSHNPEVTREQAMDIKWSTEWSLTKIKQGRAYLWSCYKK